MTKELILISKSSDGFGEETIDRYVAKQAEGDIGVVTFGLQDVNQAMSELNKMYAPYGAKVRAIKELDDLYGLNLVLFPDIDDVQACLDKLAAKEMDILLRPQWKKGNVILAGVGTGARMLGWDMSVDPKSVELRRGHGPMAGALIVPNWDMTDPQWREQLLGEHRSYCIIAIDADTAIVWRNGQMEVLGKGSVELLGRTQGKWAAGETFTILA